MKRKKSRQVKNLYLIRIIRELWDKLPTGSSLRINKIRAYCLGELEEDYSAPQVRHALWALHAEVNRQNSGVNIFSAIPEMDGRQFVGLIKIGRESDAEGKKALESYRRTATAKEGKRVETQRAYLAADIHKRLLASKTAANILIAAGLSPVIKELPAHR